LPLEPLFGDLVCKTDSKAGFSQKKKDCAIWMELDREKREDYASRP
jgi:hypothetical protein